MRRHHDDVLPVIEVMRDRELRPRANAVSRRARMPLGWTGRASSSTSVPDG
ncbi:hypothetical protein [Streptomyces sp. NPDC090112]|uniref:hypothetical protein n=1 Tax=Streptomyces sp. NPDC090112 TaxID=3365949 RepID=UPI0038198101